MLLLLQVTVPTWAYIQRAGEQNSQADLCYSMMMVLVQHAGGQGQSLSTSLTIFVSPAGQVGTSTCCRLLQWHRGWHLPSESSELEAEEGDLVEAVQSSISTPILQETIDVGRVNSLLRCGAQRL